MRIKVYTISAAIVLALGGGFLLLKPFLSDRAETPAPPYVKASSSPKGRGEDLVARYEYDRLRLQDPALGRIPPNIRAQEIAFAKRLNQRNRALGKAIPGETTAVTWTERGPNNIGGRTRALAIDAADPTRLLAGGVSGGMWLSTDGGSSWSKTTGASQLHSVTAVVQDTRPGKTDTWFYGTGEYRGNSADANKGSAFYYGNGLFKSTDGGNSWTQLASTVGTSLTAFDNLWDYVWNVVVDTSNTTQDEVYAATYSTIYRSIDGGANWTIVLGGWLSSYSSYTDVAITSTGVVYATMSSAGDSAGIWRSSDGMNWTDITPGGWPNNYSRVTLAIAPSNEDVVYFLAAGTGSTVDHDLWKYTFVSGDGSGGGGSWVDRSANLPSDGGYTGDFDSQGSYDLIVKVKPDDEDFVIIGGTVLYTSTDGFATSGNTTRIGGYDNINDYSQFVNHHADQHALVFFPGMPDTVYSGHDGGISRTDSITANPVVWADMNTSYNVTQFYTIAIDYATTSDYLLGGTQDNGNLMLTAGGLGGWFDPWFGGDGAYTAFAPGFSGSGIGGTVYVSTQNGALGRRKNVTDAGGGGNWSKLTPTGASGMLFINPFALDPVDADVMYYPAGGSLWRNDSLSGIPDFQSSTTEGWTELTNAQQAGYTIGALGVTTAVPAHRLYFGAYKFGAVPKILYLENAHTSTAAPTDISPSSGNWPTGGWISSIAVNPADGAEILVALSNYGVSSLWHAADAGTTWVEVEGNLAGTDGPSVRSATILPLTGGTHYFIGTSTGVYATTILNGASTTWVQEGQSEIGNVVVDMVVSRTTDGLVAAGTHGRGVFSAILDPNTRPEAVADIVTTEEDVEVIHNVLSNDQDANGDLLAVSDIWGGAHGDALIEGTTNIFYLPESNYYGPDTVTYVVSDGRGGLDTAGVSITVTPVNDAPAAFALVTPAHQSTLDLTNTNVVTDTLTLSWNASSDVEGDAITYHLRLTGDLSLLPFAGTGNSPLKMAYSDVAAVMSSSANSSLTGTWTILAKDGTDSTFAADPFTLTLDASTLANDPDDLLPVQFALRQNYPNPFNPSTTLRLEVPQVRQVQMIVYDLLGQEVVRLLDREMQPGYFDVVWDGRTTSGAAVAAGVYFARVVTPDYSRTIKMLLLK